MAEDAQVYTYTSDQAQAFSRRSTPDEVTQWWTATQDTHLAQLQQPTTWDETNRSVIVRDVYAGQDLQLMHLLAYVGQFGTDGLSTGFRSRGRDQFGIDQELLRVAEKRGFSVRFPQAAIAPDFYLPFETNIILEVPDWRGNKARFGSLPSVTREWDEVLRIIAQADAAAATAGQLDTPHEDRLVGAYNAARIKLDLARAGLRENLPFWFSE